MSFKKHFYKTIFAYGGFTYLNQIVNFLSTIIVSRFLMPEEYGVVALITVFTGFVMVLTDTGLYHEIIRTDYKITYFKAINNLSFFMGVFLFLLMLFLAYPIAVFYSNTQLLLPIILLSVVFIPQTLITVPSAMLAKKIMFKKLGWISFIVNSFKIVLTISLAVAGFSFWALIIPNVVGPIISYFWIASAADFPFRIYKKKYTLLGFRHAKILMKNIAGFNLINYWSRNSDNLLIGKFFGESDLGLYNRAYRFITLSMKLITGIFGKVLSPSFKELLVKNKRIDNEYFSILGVISLLNYPIGFILIAFSDKLVLLLWGENWLQVAPYLPYFGLLLLTQTLVSVSGQIYILLNKEKTYFILGTIGSIISIVAIVLGIMQSTLDVAKYYTAAHIFLIAPIQMYFGFYKSLKFQFKKLIIFWLPKILLSGLIFISLWNSYYYRSLILLGLYGIHLLIMQKTDIYNLFLHIAKKIKRS